MTLGDNIKREAHRRLQSAEHDLRAARWSLKGNAVTAARTFALVLVLWIAITPVAWMNAGNRTIKAVDAAETAEAAEATNDAARYAWMVLSLAGTQVERHDTGGVSITAPPLTGKPAGGLVVPASLAAFSEAPAAMPSTELASDELASADLAGRSLPAASAVETTVVLGGGASWDRRNELWLAALFPAGDAPGGAALVWYRNLSGFFPSWELVLYPDPPSVADLARQHDLNRLGLEGNYTVLTKATPEVGHVYRAALSIDRTTGDAHVSVVNLSRGNVIYQGVVSLRPHETTLIPAAGGFAQCQRCPGDNWQLSFDSIKYWTSFVPFASSWRLLRETSAGLQPVVTTYVERFEPLYVEATLPDTQAPGTLTLIASGPGHSAGRSVPLVDLTGVSGKLAVPVSLAEMPAGKLTLTLQYETPAGRWDLISRSYQLITGTLDLRVVADRLVGHDWSGNVLVEAAFQTAGTAGAELTGSPDRSSELSTQLSPELSLDLSLDVAVLVPAAGGWEPVSQQRIVYEGLDMLALGQEPVSLPVHVPLDFPEPTVVRIALSPTTNVPDEFELTIRPKEVDFLTMPRTPDPQSRNYTFDGSISLEVLNNYLSRAVTMLGFGDPDNAELLDDLRFIANTGAKFIGRAAYIWGAPADDEVHFQAAERAARLAHEMDPELILQACIFEAVYEGIERIPIPAWVFEEFGLPVEERNFDYEAMLFDDGRFVNQWAPGGSVPDMSKLETKMWFFYRAKRYIDAGYEAIHFGQVHLMGANDPGFRHWQEILDRIRAYAKRHARRHMLIADAHTHGIVIDGKLLFDFHSYPLRIAEVPGKPLEGHLVKGRIDSIYGRSKSGVTPSGWYADPLPYLVEVDNWGSSGRGGQSIDEWWVWGYDEISWFARQDENYRNQWLRYAWRWVRETDPAGWFQMPAKRVLHDPVNGVSTYRAHTASAANQHGFNQEETIKAIWAEEE